MAKRKSILQENLSQCLLCENTNNIHIHHVFGAANRGLSEKYHLIVALCQEHHTGDCGVHFNRYIDLKLKAFAQKKFEETYPNTNFYDVFGRNWK